MKSSLSFLFNSTLKVFLNLHSRKLLIEIHLNRQSLCCVKTCVMLSFLLSSLFKCSFQTQQTRGRRCRTILRRYIDNLFDQFRSIIIDVHDQQVQQFVFRQKVERVSTSAICHSTTNHVPCSFIQFPVSHFEWLVSCYQLMNFYFYANYSVPCLSSQFNLITITIVIIAISLIT